MQYKKIERKEAVEKGTKIAEEMQRSINENYTGVHHISSLTKDVTPYVTYGVTSLVSHHSKQ